MISYTSYKVIGSIKHNNTLEGTMKYLLGYKRILGDRENKYLGN